VWPESNTRRRERGVLVRRGGSDAGRLRRVTVPRPAVSVGGRDGRAEVYADLPGRRPYWCSGAVAARRGGNRHREGEHSAGRGEGAKLRVSIVL